MLLTVTTTHEPATDLGYLLVKHPDRVHVFDVPTGTAYVCFPEASEQRCTAALVLEVDPGRLSGGPQGRHPAGSGAARAPNKGPSALGRYVNDRPYAASSLVAAALNRAFRSAMRGESRDRPELAATPIPLTITVSALRCSAVSHPRLHPPAEGVDLATRLLAPLGWTVRTTPVPLDPTRPDWGDSRYLDLSIMGTLRLADALNQLYVLLPVFDDAKHYWVAPDEVDKLLRAGDGWLAEHPDRELITARYLMRRRALTADANERLDALRTTEGTVEPEEAPTDEDVELPAAEQRVPLAEQRREAVVAQLRERGAASVLDLGCGAGALLADLVRDKRFTRLVGVDISTTALELAQRRLRPEQLRDRLTLVQSALTYADDRLVGFDAAVLMEVIEHVDEPRLPALAASVFGHTRPSTVVVTTPNVEYNVRYEAMTQPMRHHDHRFEWTRAQFADWCATVARDYGYSVTITGVGEEDPELGHPTQLATFAQLAERSVGHSAQLAERSVGHSAQLAERSVEKSAKETA